MSASSPTPAPPPAAPPDPAAQRRRVWIAVAAVVGLWAVIYLSVVLAFVAGQSAEPTPADPHASHEPAPAGDH